MQCKLSMLELWNLSTTMRSHLLIGRLGQWRPAFYEPLAVETQVSLILITSSTEPGCSSS